MLKTQLEKLGANATMRVTAIDTFLRGTIGDQAAAALNKVLITADAVQAVEQLISKHSNQGAASFSQAHREPSGQPGRVSEEAYGKMSAAERWDYARQFDQKQFQNGAAR